MKYTTLQSLIIALNCQQLRKPSNASLRRSLEIGSQRLATEQNLKTLLASPALRGYAAILNSASVINLDIVETILYNDLFVLNPK